MNSLDEHLKLISESLLTISKEMEKISTLLNDLQVVPLTVDSRVALSDIPAAVYSAGGTAGTARAKKNGNGTKVTGSVYDVIKRCRKGTSIPRLREKTGLDSRQISNALYKLTKKGLIVAKSRGLYVKV